MYSNNQSSGTMVYPCDFHRAQAWERWTSKTANGVSPSKEEVLAKLRLVANSETEAIYQQRVRDLRSPVSGRRIRISADGLQIPG